MDCIVHGVAKSQTRLRDLKKKIYKVGVYVFHVKTFDIFFADKLKHEVPILELF